MPGTRSAVARRGAWSRGQVLKSLGYAERQVSQYFTRLPAVAHCSTPAPGATVSILSAMGKSRTLAFTEGGQAR
jgi:hypothetical protein